MIRTLDILFSDLINLQSLEITVLSYVGKLRIAIAVEKDFIDMKKLKACIQGSLDTIFEAAVPI